VLIVDDSALTLTHTQQALEEGGFEVQTAMDLAALDGLAPGGTDLVLMDVRLPEVYGDDVALWLRAARGVKVPILLFSDLGVDELAARARDAKVEGYVSKRDGIGAVVARVRAVLGVAEQPLASSTSEQRAVADFAPTARTRLRRARQLAANGAPGYAAAIAGEMHTLGGEAGLVGARAVAEAADGVQRAARNEDDDGAIAGALDQLAGAIAALGPESPTRAAAGGSGGRVLIVDDSDFYRSTLGVLLEQAGHEVQDARVPTQARELLERHDFDLVILDVNLGEGSGLDLVPWVNARQPRARVVVVSGGDPVAPIAGVDLVLGKSLEAGALLAKLERLLAR
jgi:DNA-binding response OmpR family regulator